MADQTLDETAESAEAAAATPAPGRRKLVMLVGGGLALVAATGAGLYFTGMADKLIGHTKEVVEVVVAPAAVFFDLPDLLVNLNTTGRKPSFLKLSVSLELERGQDLPRLQAVMPRIIDNFQVYLRELRVEDLRGSGGIYRLREELLTRVNAATAPVKVVDVLFKEMLVQ
jgi:flagellar FliL protein